jgi:hypothetical protein
MSRQGAAKVPAQVPTQTADQTDMPTMANVVQGPSLLLTSLHRPEPTLMMLPGLRSLPFWTNSTGQVAYQDPQMTDRATFATPRAGYSSGVSSSGETGLHDIGL